MVNSMKNPKQKECLNRDHVTGRSTNHINLYDHSTRTLNIEPKQNSGKLTESWKIIFELSQTRNRKCQCHESLLKHIAFFQDDSQIVYRLFLYVLIHHCVYHRSHVKDR